MCVSLIFVFFSLIDVLELFTKIIIVIDEWLFFAGNKFL